MIQHACVVYSEYFKMIYNRHFYFFVCPTCHEILVEVIIIIRARVGNKKNKSEYIYVRAKNEFLLIFKERCFSSPL